ncbi:MAG: S49 family peptidase [Magnetococcus sp. MYC-9]
MMNKLEPGLSDADSPVGLSPDRVGIEWLERVEASRAEERAALESILVEHLKEQKRLRRGKNGFRLFIALYLLALFWAGTAEQWRHLELQAIPHKKHTAVVDIRGPILAATNNSAEMIVKGLTKAFEDPNTAGVVLRINSPGGSPVQSGQVYDEITRLRQRFPGMPFFAALEDLCASGGYYIAAAAPFIYADKATLVGSIGVVLQGFGFQETLNKLGMESRLMTAGKNKAFLSPFAPLDESEKSHAQTLLSTIHKQFVEAVRKGRGERLRTWKAELFEGLIWTGEEAVELGLVDGLGSVAWLARERIKEERVVDFTQKSDWLSRISKEMGIH